MGSAPTTTQGQATNDAATDARAWRVPVALGVGLLGVGGFFVLVALGLSILSSIDY